MTLNLAENQLWKVDHQCCMELIYLVLGLHVHICLSLFRFLANVNSRSPSLYAIAVPSVVCNVGAPYSAGWNFRQFFNAIWYLGHLLTFTENFTEIIPGEPSAGGLNARGVVKYSYISGKLVLITNGKSYMTFRLVPKSVTLNGKMAIILRYFYRIW